MAEIERKVAILGYRSVGKSSLTIQFVQNQFVDSYDPTIENTFTKQHKFRGKDFRLQLIDTAGQDEYSLFPRSYSMDIHGYVLVYAINSTKSFEVIKVIYDKILDMTGKVKVPLVLVGNKLDLNREREVDRNKGQSLAQQWDASFIETSAKDNQQVREIFNRCVFEIEKHAGNLPTDNNSGKCILS